MNSRQVKELLSAAVPAGCPVLLVGEPGTGKTSIAEQVAKEIKYDFIYTDLGTSDPTRIEGMPWPQPAKGEAEFLPFGDLAKALRATKPTFWLMDDIGWATIATQNSVAHLIHERRTPSGARIPDCVTIVGTTNERTHKSGVTGMSEAVKSRFTTIVKLIPDLDIWIEDFAYPRNLAHEIISFLKFRRDLFSDFKPTADLTNSPNPRTWENAAKIVTLQLRKPVELEALRGAVGTGAGDEFWAHLQVARDLPSLEGIILNPDTAIIPENKSAKFAVAVGLASKANQKNFSSIVKYAERMHDAQLSEYATLLIKDACRRDRKIELTQAFTRLTTVSPLAAHLNAMDVD